MMKQNKSLCLGQLHYLYKRKQVVRSIISLSRRYSYLKRVVFAWLCCDDIISGTSVDTLIVDYIRFQQDLVKGDVGWLPSYLTFINHHQLSNIGPELYKDFCQVGEWVSFLLKAHRSSSWEASYTTFAYPSFRSRTRLFQLFTDLWSIHTFNIFLEHVVDNRIYVLVDILEEHRHTIFDGHLQLAQELRVVEW